jgi:hypothetical protein
MAGMAPRLVKNRPFNTIAHGVEFILSRYFDELAPFRPVDARETHHGRLATWERP